MTLQCNSSRLEIIAKQIVPIIEDITNSSLSLDNISFEFADLGRESNNLSWIEKLYMSIITGNYDGRSSSKKVNVARRLFDAPDSIITTILAHELTHASDDQNHNSIGLLINTNFDIQRLKRDLETGQEGKIPYLIKNSTRLLPAYLEKFDIQNTILESHANYVENKVREALKLQIPKFMIRELFPHVVYKLLKLMPEYSRSSRHYTDGKKLIEAVYRIERNIGTLYRNLPTREHFSNPDQYYIDISEGIQITPCPRRSSHFCFD